MNRSAATLIIVTGALALAACPVETPPSEWNREITGSVTVAEASYWNMLKMSVFSGEALGDYPQLETNTEGLDPPYRLVYEDKDNDSLLEISPTGTVLDFSGLTGTTTTYTYTVPATIPDATSSSAEYYYFVAWIDGDADDRLDMVDSSNATQVALTELNRFSRKDTTNTSDDPTTITVFHFQQTLDLNSQPTGTYKYVGFDEAAYNEQIELDNSNANGFNFTIEADTGW